MKCDEIQEMMLDVASGTGEAKPVLNEHLRGCTACANKFADMQQTMALLDEWQAPEPSPYFDTRFAARMLFHPAAGFLALLTLPRSRSARNWCLMRRLSRRHCRTYASCLRSSSGRL